MGVARKILEDRARGKLAMSLAAYALDLPVAAILDPDRSAETVLARALAMYLSHIGFGMSYGRVSQVFGRDRSTVADACRQIEERREDPRFDRWLEALERSITSAPAPYRRDAA